jgi:hypothetical protein
MSAEGWVLIIGAVAAGCVKVYELYLQHQVKATLAETTTKADTKLDSVHDLVNSAMLSMKKVYAEKCRAMADQTGDPVDLSEAAQAEREYQTHLAQQQKMDQEKR